MYVKVRDPRSASRYRPPPCRHSRQCSAYHIPFAGLHLDRNLLHHRGSPDQILHSPTLPPHLRFQQKAHDRLLGRCRRRLRLQHRADRHVHLPVHSRPQSLEPCDAWNVPEHIRCSDQPRRDQCGRGFCDGVSAYAVDLEYAAAVEAQGPITGDFYAWRLVSFRLFSNFCTARHQTLLTLGAVSLSRVSGVQRL